MGGTAPFATPKICITLDKINEGKMESGKKVILDLPIHTSILYIKVLANFDVTV